MSRSVTPKSEGPTRAPHAAALFKAMGAAVLAVCAVIFMEYMHRTGVIHLEKSQVREALNRWDDALNDALSKPGLMAAALAAHIAASRDEDLAAGLPAFMATLKADSPGVSFFVVAPGGITRWVYPREGNDVHLGRDLLHSTDASVRHEVDAALAARGPVLGNPRLLRGGTLGVVVRQAVLRDGKLWGLVTVGIDLPTLLKRGSWLSVFPYPLDVALRLPGKAPFWGDPSVFLRKPASMALSLPGGGTWDLAAVPAAGWGASMAEGQPVRYAVEVLLIMLIAGLTYSMSDRSARLRMGIERSTAEIKALNELLASELEEKKVSEARFQAFMAYLPGVVFLRDTSGRYVYVNDGWIKNSGISREDALGKAPAELLSAKEAQELAEEDAKVMAGEPLVWKEIAYPFRGETTYWMCSKFPVRDGAGQTRFVAGFSFEVTAERKAREALRESEERYRMLFERNLAGVYRCDLKGRVFECNQAFARMFGFESPEDVLRHPEHNFTAESQDHRAFIRRMEESGWVKNWESQTHRKDGTTFWALENASRVEEPGSEPFIEGTIFDITDRRDLAAQVARTEKLETAFKITQGLAHEVRNPLFAIQVNVNAWAKSRPSGAEADPHVQYVLDHVQRLSRLLSSLMELGYSLEKEELADVMPDMLVQEAWTLARAECPEREVQLIVDPSPSPATVRIASSRMVRALAHLLANAIEVTPEGQPIHVATRREKGTYVLLIRDEGAGISPAIAAHLFDPFVTTRTGRPGLGLALARHTIEIHGGTLTAANNDPLPGATFTVTLPATSPERTGQTGAERKPEPAPANGGSGAAAI